MRTAGIGAGTRARLREWALLDHDLCIVGGGINGTGIARDAAGRGLRVLLCERGDLHLSAAGIARVTGWMRLRAHRAEAALG